MAMRRKFDLKRFNKDREDSLERSKKGELKLIAPSKIDLIVSPIIERLRAERHPLYKKSEECLHKLACGCKLPLIKRTKPECEACL